MRKIFTFDVVYWDFLTTFPVMLLTAFVTTKPLLAIASKSNNQILRLGIFAALICWPLMASDWALETCPSAFDRYKALFIGCVRRTLGAMRFSAFTYMFYFNFGCIVSLLMLEHSRSGAKYPSLKDVLTKSHWIAFAILYSIEFWYAVPVFQQYNRSWEYFNWEGYRRFPMSAPLTLAWGFMSQSVGILALTMTALLRPRISKLAESIPRWLHQILSMKCKILEHFGANVLLFLTVSNIVIHGFFNVDWRQFQLRGETKSSKSRKSEQAYSIAEWEWVVLAAAVGQILFVELLRYLVRSSRK
jgi:mannose/fructose/N-acetylgalactosamine-specific phosphotransferase system component IIC